MAAASDSTVTPAPPRARPAEVDTSCFWPVLGLLGLALAWLLVAGVLAVLASIKLHGPGFLAEWPWLTYGRVQPAAGHAFVFGFASQIGLGIALWLIARLGGTWLTGGVGLLLVGGFWNLGVALGVFGILLGGGTGFESLEFPRYVPPILMTAYVCLAAWGLIAFGRRRPGDLYVSQWYLLAALFAFPWLYASATLLTVYSPLRGVLQVAAQAWFAHNLATLWLGFLGLGSLFYFLPKLTGRPVPSRSLAVFGFWSLAIFGPLGGLQRYVGGPFPAWMSSLSVVASVLNLFGVVAVALNLYPVVRAAPRLPGEAAMPALRFARLAYYAYLLGAGLSSLSALGFLRRTTQFTLFTPGLDHLWLDGFFALAMLGAAYYVVPKLTGRDWPSPGLTRLHFYCQVVGVGLFFVAYAAGGLVHGTTMNDPALPFFYVIKRYLPFAATGTLANLILLVGYGALAAHVAWLITRWCRDVCAPLARELLEPTATAQEVKA